MKWPCQVVPVVVVSEVLCRALSLYEAQAGGQGTVGITTASCLCLEHRQLLHEHVLRLQQDHPLDGEARLLPALPMLWVLPPAPLERRVHGPHRGRNGYVSSAQSWDCPHDTLVPTDTLDRGLSLTDGLAKRIPPRHLLH